MSIFNRFTNIMSANINALLDKCEDPEKMIDEYLRDAMEDFAEVKKETAQVMAVEARAKRALDKHLQEVAKYENMARKAITAGNDDDARVLLSKKQSLDAETANLQATYDVAKANADKLRQMHNKLANDIETLRTRRNNVKATMAVAKTQKTINSMSSGSDKISGSMGAFERMEEKAMNMLDSANAMASLNEEPVDPVDELEAKYGTGSTSDVDSELARLKAEMGM